MTPGQSIDAPNISNTMVLEEALQVVSHTDSQSANVVDEQGHSLGSITTRQIVDGLARPAVGSQEETRYR